MPSTQRVNKALPGIAAQEDLLKKIREIYAIDYADTSFNGRRALSRRLIEASNQTRKDSDAKFILLREARDVAASVGDVTTAFEAADILAATFPVAKLSERFEVMRAAANSLTAPKADLAAASICMDLADQCVAEGDYSRAQILLSLAETTTRQAKSVPYARWILSRMASLKPKADAYDSAKPAEAKLAESPDDPEANLVMGRFVAFVKGDIDAGLSLLSKGSDQELAALADEDLDAAENVPDELRLANAWWAMADRQPNQFRSAIRCRAGFWYHQVSPGLDGLDKALAERRLQELNPPATRKARIEHPPDALKLTNHWYRASIAEVSWDVAQRLCTEAGGRLACVETRAEGQLMAKLARGRMLWLGAAADGSGRWSWISGNDMVYNNWADGQPISSAAETHPVTSPEGTWKTWIGKAGFICEWSE
jgi:hypothetical protein